MIKVKRSEVKVEKSKVKIYLGHGEGSNWVNSPKPGLKCKSKKESEARPPFFDPRPYLKSWD